MSDIAGRATWTTVAFGDVVNYIKDRVSDVANCGLTEYIRGEHFVPGNLHLNGKSILGDGKHGSAFCMRFHPGDVLYVSRNPQLRKAAIVDFEGICANTTYVCRANEKYLLQELLPFIMQTESFVEYTIRHKRGSTNFYLNWSDIAGYEFLLPPLKKQRQIAQVLKACERATNSIQQLINATDVVYLASLCELFSCSIEPEPTDRISYGSNGANWEWRRVDEMFSLQLGKMSSKKARESEGHAKYIKNNNVLWGRFSLDNLPSMSFNQREREKYTLESGDLLVCEGGEIGRAAIWSGDHQDIYYQKALHRLRPIRPDANTMFFMHYLRACSINGILSRIATGGTILHLPRERLAELRLPFPNISEQRRCLDILEALQDCQQASTKRSDQLKSIKRAILIKVQTP